MMTLSSALKVFVMSCEKMVRGFILKVFDTSIVKLPPCSYTRRASGLFDWLSEPST